MLGFIYKITCVSTGRSYIGKTSNYGNRISTHYSHLRRGVHVSRLMQMDFDYYGIDSFSSVVLCRGSMEYMGNMESFMIRFYRPEYNTANVGYSKVDSSHGLLCKFGYEWATCWGKPKVIAPPIEKEVVKPKENDIVEVKRGRGRPRIVGEVSIRTLQHRRKLSGENRVVGRPRKEESPNK